MDSNETDTQSNQTPLLSSLRSSTPNSGEYRSTNTELLTRQEQSAQSAYSEQNQSHSTESADNDPLPSSPSNEIYLSAENDFRRDSVRSTSVIDDSGMHTGRNIKRNGTLPSLSKGSHFCFTFHLIHFRRAMMELLISFTRTSQVEPDALRIFDTIMFLNAHVRFQLNFFMTHYRCCLRR
uniref:Uncharacterized protein n=1 Tax=Setaria digitata TaxID=48799 RepID=A0A915PDG0_9BILA